MPSGTGTFTSWLGTLFGHPELEVRRLLQDESALQFLVAWSLFESKCFGGFVQAVEIERYAKATSPALDPALLHDGVEHFHARYQNEKLFENLMYKQKNERLLALLKRPFTGITADDKLYLLVFVIYRYRNNIFHGNKGVLSWLQYRVQIQHCIQAMQVLVSHAEQISPTMNAEAA